METKKSKLEDLRIDRAIARTKALACLRKYRDTRNEYWLDTAELHLETVERLCALLSDFDDPLVWIGAERADYDRNGQLLRR